MLNTPFSPWPSYSEEEAEAISRVLLSNRVNYWTGTEARDFEKEFATFVGSKHAIALANGTVALDLALKALGIGANDEVIVSPRSFIASVSSVVNAGAIPVFADVDKNSQAITAASIEPLITVKTRAIICVHLAGWPCDMASMMALAKKHDLFVIEDCAQAHGARYKNQSVGAQGHIGAWSFCQDKIISTGGEGGMVTTNDSALYASMWAYKDHGKSLDAVYSRQHPPGFRWLHESFGTNWRMTEIQAVIGRLQLKKLPSWQETRLAYARQIWNAASPFANARVPELPDFITHAAYKCYFFVEPKALKSGASRDSLMQAINAAGVPCYSGSCSEIYLEKAFDNTGFRPKTRLAIAKELGETSLMFLVHPSLLPSEIDLSCQVIKNVLATHLKEQRLCVANC